MHENLDIIFIDKKYEEVGRLRASTKQKYTWIYKLGDIHKEIKFFHSVKSGKKLVLLDGIVIYDSKWFYFNFKIIIFYIKVIKKRSFSMSLLGKILNLLYNKIKKALILELIP